MTGIVSPRLGILVVLMLLTVLVVRRRPVTAAVPRDRRVTLRSIALTAAAVTIVLTTWVWGGWGAPAVVDDEAAYLLQAELFAAGRWRASSPVPPEAFTQPAVLVTPVMAPKMPPGHALALVPGVKLGIPGVVPVLMTGFIAALIVLLVGKVRSPGVAILTVALWLTAAGQWRWRASYFSENTTGALWLLGWWLLVQWRRSHRGPWLIGLAATVGWLAVTRPLTAVAFAIPVGVVVIRDVVRFRHRAAFLGAIGVGMVILLLLPIQNREVLGSWSASPLARYTSQYMPFDRIGFGLDSTRPTIGLPPVIAGAQLPFIARHREHTPSRLPRVLRDRLAVLGHSLFSGWRVLWIPALVIGIVLLGPVEWFAVLSGFGLYLAYLLYAHEPHWSVYYYEVLPVAVFVLAVGIEWGLARAARAPQLPLGGAILAALAVCGVASADLGAARLFRADAQRPYRELAAAVRADGAARLLVIVRYPAGHDPNVNLVRNVVDPTAARVVTALDLGPQGNAVTIAAHPDRAVRYWDVDEARLSPPDSSETAIP